MAAACLVVTLACGLSEFMVSQYYVSQESTGKVTQQVAELTSLLSLEKGKGKSLEDDLASLQASLSSLRADNERLSGVAGLSGEKDARIAGLTKELDEQKGLSNDALARIDLLQRQIAALNEALVAAQSKDKESQARISYLGARLNVVLARQVQELQRSVAGEASLD